MIIAEKFKFLMITVCIAIFGLYFFGVDANKLLPNIDSSKDRDLIKPDNIVSFSNHHEPVNNIVGNTDNKEHQSKVYETLMGSTADAAEVKAWYAARGLLFLTGAEKEYLSYSQETLEKLSEGGDIRAMQVLAKMYLDESHFKQYGFIPAQAQYWRAATYGSTEAIIQLATIHKVLAYDMVDVNIDKTADVLQRKHDAAFEVLALYRAAELRGDLWSGENPVALFKELNHLELSSHDQIVVDERANDILAELVRKREEIGLGDFDNSTPESVKKFFKKIEK